MLENQNQNDELSLKDLIFKISTWYQHLLSKWLLILLCAVISGIIGYAYAYFKKTEYIATTTFVLEEGPSGGGAMALGNLSGLASMAGIDIGGGGGLFTGDNILQLYKSRTMIETALLTHSDFSNKEELLIDRFIEFNNLKNKWNSVNWQKVSFADRSKFTIVEDSILREVTKDLNKNYLSVGKPDKKLSIIKVDVNAKDEAFAKAFSDAIVNSVNRFYIETKTKRAAENVDILQQKTDSVRAVMNGSIKIAADVLDATPNLNPTRQAQRSAPVQRSQFSAETNKAILGELVKNLEMSKITLRKETPLIQVIDQPVFPLEEVKLGPLKTALLSSLVLTLLLMFVLVISKIIKDA